MAASLAPTLRFALALLLFFGGVISGAALSGERRSAPWAVRLAGVCALVAAWVVPPAWPLARLFAAAFGLLAMGRALDLARRPAGLSLPARLCFMVSMFDLRAARREPARVDVREALWFGVHLLIFAACWYVAYGLRPDPDSSIEHVQRWGAGLVLIYALAELIQSSQLLLYRLVGVELPRINDYPIVSRTLAEFWGRRWNRVVSGWLSENLFMPLARRRRARLGMIAAFLVSALVHLWLAWIPVDLGAGLIMASFFIVHGVGLLAERSLGVTRWRPGAQRLWTGAWIVLASPLFVDPALAMLDGFNAAWRVLLGL